VGIRELDLEGGIFLASGRGEKRENTERFTKMGKVSPHNKKSISTLSIRKDQFVRSD